MKESQPLDKVVQGDVEVKTPEKVEKVAEAVETKSPQTPPQRIQTPPLSLIKPPDKQHKTSVKLPEISSEKSPEKVKKERLKVEMKIERKKSPKKIEKPKVNIFLEDSDEVNEFESVALEFKSKWSSPLIMKQEDEIPQIVPAPTVEIKINSSFPGIPAVVESPEKSPLLPALVTDNLFAASSVHIGKSPTPSPPPKLTTPKVRNVCSFLSDIASGNIFSGLGLGSGLYDDDSRNLELKINDSRAESEVKLPEMKKMNNKLNLDLDCIMEPDTTADKIVEKLPERRPTSDGESDSDDSDSDTSSSSDSDSDDTTSESEESSDESSEDEVPAFTQGFGRFNSSSMPMVTQIKLSTSEAPAIANAMIPSRFQSHCNIVKPPGMLTNPSKPCIYPNMAPALPTVQSPFAIGQLQFPIPFKIYSLRDTNNSQVFPTAVQPMATVIIPAEKEKVPERDRREKRRSRSHSRDREKKRLKDDRRKTPPPPRRISPTPNKKRQIDDRKSIDQRRMEPSPRHSSHSSHSSRASHNSR